MKTISGKFEPNQRQWILVDADNQVLGRLAAKIAMRLRGKHLPQFTPHVDLGDFVVVVNADKIVMTGKKLDQKVYRHHSGYMGGLKTTPAKRIHQEDPGRIIKMAVWGMLPKNRLGRKLIKKLKVYGGADHPHEAQQPAAVAL